MTRTTSTSTLADLAASIAAALPRLLVLSAPAGYGKGGFSRSYAAQYVGQLTLCDVSDQVDPAISILDALTAPDLRRAGRTAADRLAQTPEAASDNARQALRREWPSGDDPHVFAIRDVKAALATPAGADLFGELVATLPPGRVLLISTRAALPPALHDSVRTTSSRIVTTEDLKLTLEGTLALAAEDGVHATTATTIYDLAQGWPLVTRLLLRSAARGERIEDLEEAARSLPAGALLSFAVHRTVAGLEDMVRKALVVTSLLRSATHSQLIRVLGNDCDDLVFGRMTSLPGVVTAGQEAAVHPEISALLGERFAALVCTCFERTLTALTGEGAYAEAAQVALQRGDVLRAAAIIDAAPPYTAAPVSLAEYGQIADRLDRHLLMQFPNLWIATIPYRSFAVDRATFLREAETVHYCLPPGASPDQRAASLMLLASAYFNAGRRGEGERLIQEALHGFALDANSARSSLLHFSAWFHGMEGRFSAARALAAEAAQIARGGFGETQTLHYIDAHEAAYRGQNDRVIVIIDELLRRSDALPLHRANTAANGALFTWVNGDDDHFLHYVRVLEDALTPGLERGFSPIVDGARGRPVAPPDGYHWGIGQAQGQLFRLGSVRDAREALDAARAAAHFADERGDPYTQLLAHAALFVLDCGVRQSEAENLRTIVEPIESKEMRFAVDALVRGEPAGILESFLSRRVRHDLVSPPAPVVEVELMAGRVLRDGSPIRLSDKELELIVVLGSAPAPLSRERIAEALWDHLDPEEWSNNVKVTLSRLRGKLGTRDAVLLVDGRYRLSPAIDVDLRRAEAVVRGSPSVRLDDTRREELRRIVASASSDALARYERAAPLRLLKSRIEEVVVRAGMLLAADAFDHGDHDETLRLASSVAAIDPLNEAACEMSVRVLLAQGLIDAARRAVRQYATILAEELDATPSARLLDLVRTG